MTMGDLIERDWVLKRMVFEPDYEVVQMAPAVEAEQVITGETSDGYHTFNELYHHRAVLFSVIVKAFEDKAWKSRKHHDGTMYDGMFIVGVETPYGQATYHYDMEPYWEMFCCKEIERAPEWDGHTPAQAIERIGKLEPVRWEKIPGFNGLYEINTLSQIRNADGKILKQQIRREKYTCYKVVHLWKDGKYHHKGVHRLMAETFLPNPDGLPVVNHKDEDGTNNLLCNLEWCDRGYNASYGTSPKKISKAFKGKVSEKRISVQQLKDGKIIREYACAGIAEKETGISMSNIRLVCRGVRKLAGGFEWRYSAKMDGGSADD